MISPAVEMLRNFEAEDVYLQISGLSMLPTGAFIPGIVGVVVPFYMMMSI